MSTSKDVAKLAGVSHTTVSRAFRGDVKLRKETYDKVMEAATQLNYIPNYFASSLKQCRSKAIGLIISDMANPFFIFIAEQIENLLSEQDYRLFISFDGNEIDKQQRAIQTMIATQVESIIFTPKPTDKIPDYINNPNLHFIQLFGNPYPNISHINFNDFHGAFIGAKYLLEKGHRKILFIGGDDRRNGFISAYEGYNSSPYFLENYNLNNHELFLAQIIKGIKDYMPTAVFAVGNLAGRFCYDALKTLAIKFPDDISFMMYDDLEWTQMMDITVIAHPIEQLLKCLVEILMNSVNNDISPSINTFKPFLIERSSVKSIN